MASLSGMVETDMDDTLANTIPSPDSNQENGPAKKKGRGKASSKKFTKPRTRRSGDGIVPKKAAPKAKTGSKRAPLKEQTNVQHAEDTEDVDEFDVPANEDTVMDELVETKQPNKRKAPAKKMGRPPKKAAIEKINAVEKDGEFEYTPTTARQMKGVKQNARTQAQSSDVNKRQPSKEPQAQEKVIPETQVPIEDEPCGLPEDDEDDEDAIPQSVFRPTTKARTGGGIRHRPVARNRAGSASDTERLGNDPAMRRKLGNMTTKFENLEMKYKNLKDTLAKEAEQNSKNFETKLQAKAKGMTS